MLKKLSIFALNIVFMVNKDKLYAEIDEYCALNAIDDIDSFKVKCLSVGFNIERYGISPHDNINRENNGVLEPENGKKTDEGSVVVKRRKIKIINKNNSGEDD